MEVEIVWTVKAQPHRASLPPYYTGQSKLYSQPRIMGSENRFHYLRGGRQSQITKSDMATVRLDVLEAIFVSVEHTSVLPLGLFTSR